MRSQAIRNSRVNLALLSLVFRVFRKDKLYSFLNLAGLAFSFCCFLVIFLYLNSEMTFDQHFDDHDRIYRLNAELEILGDRTENARTGSQIAPLLAQDYAQFEDFVRLNPFDGKGMLFIRDGESVFWDQMNTIFGADNSVFDIFGLNIISGNVGKALTEPRSIAISQSMAELLFGDEIPIGQELGVQFSSNTYTVVLVFADLPKNTSHWFNVLFSHSSLTLAPDAENYFEYGIANPVSYTFFKLSPEMDAGGFSDIFGDFAARHVNEGFQRAYSGQNPQMNFRLQPLEEIYLSAPLEGDVSKGNPVTLYALVAVAVFILGIASINYMNLSTARFARRAKEMGVRRTLGASKRSLAFQFLSEGVLFSLLALLIGIGIGEALFFGSLDQALLGKELSIFSSNGGNLLLQLALIACAIGLVSAAYPAIYFSSIKPIEAFRPIMKVSRLGITLRSIFVGLQMFVSISVIAGALAMLQQVSFMKNQPLGFEKDNKLVVWVNTIANGSDYRSLISELNRHSGISNVTMADEIPGTQVFGESLTMRNDRGENVSFFAETHSVDENYFDTFSIPLIDGRNFTSGNRSSDDVTVDPYLVNESFVKRMEWTDAVGKQLLIPAFGISGEVIGVYSDYNFSSLHNQIRPQYVRFFYDDFRWQRYLVMDIDPSQTQDILKYVEDHLTSLMPQTPFEYTFLNEILDGLYASEDRQTRLTLIGSVVAIVVSMLGLFGLTTYTIDQRTKEIGIRRILGASVTRILATMFKGIFTVTIVAGLASSILVVYALNIWLQEFAYRTSIGPATYVTAVLAASLVVFFSVGIQSVIVSKHSPVNAIRHE